MIGIETAEKLLDFDVRIKSAPRAREQLEGAVAVHNILCRHKVAYLADEVGMGKTYVALGAIALFRHIDPSFRVLVMAPRENIQQKWRKELGNFVANNVRHADLRVKGLDGRPARTPAMCNNLLELVREVTLDPNRDFFMRFSSFSLPLGKDADSWAGKRRELTRLLPWLPDELFDLRNKQQFKDNFARGICCAMPVFDLVVVDEGHNLKHGYSEHTAARNRVMALAFGRDTSPGLQKLLPEYGARARRVLFLSATPIEESYSQLWNQLDIFGLAEPFDDLDRADLSDDAKKKIAAQFLVRRVTGIRLKDADEDLTKNLYRREWRRGGVVQHDEPIVVEDVRQRLTVALVQKKVSELLGSSRFKSSFQIGMLASFESFLETTKTKRADEEDSPFDDSEQTDDDLEKEGIDVHAVNRIAKSYRKHFHAEMPHPKMDALVSAMSDSWIKGRKSLVFVRRIASVKELKRKLDDSYDTWLEARLRGELPASVIPDLERVLVEYRSRKLAARATDADLSNPDDKAGSRTQTDDYGGLDTFFAWFFRGEEASGVVTGTNIRKRLDGKGGVYSTFFERNHVMDLFGTRPGGTAAAVARALEISPEKLAEKVRSGARLFTGRTQRWDRAVCFEAAQAATIELLASSTCPQQEAARVIWHERFENTKSLDPAKTVPDLIDWLELPTFWTELLQRPALRDRLWPAPVSDSPRLAFREREQRADLLSTMARLGHAFIDLYIMTINRLGSLSPRARDPLDQDEDRGATAVEAFLDLLEGQMKSAEGERSWRAYDELSAAAQNFDLILDVNDPEARTASLSETARRFGALLRQQRPVGGMSGAVNQTLVRQFRMPGYPLVLVSTDLLREGEDLHTFCSSVFHYGISWTPSSMEQRVGRVDRIQSQTERRLTRLKEPLSGDDMLQVYYPHLEDTVELLQVRRVLGRLNEFLRLMHEGLGVGKAEPNKIDLNREINAVCPQIEQIRERLKSSFPVARQLLSGTEKTTVAPDFAAWAETRFRALAAVSPPGISVRWEKDSPTGMLLGTLWLGRRKQPFALHLRSFAERLVVRCVSPIGRVGPEGIADRILEVDAALPVRLGAIRTADKEQTFDLTVEDDVLLGSEAHDSERVGALIARVAKQADLLEQELLPGKDEPLKTFRKDLADDGGTI